MTTAFVTMADRSYLPGATVLRKSVLRHNPDLTEIPWLLISPDLQPTDAPGFTVVPVRPEDYAFRARNSRFAMAFCKLALFCDPIFRKPERLVFLDADMLCVGEIEELTRQAHGLCMAPDAGGQREMYPKHKGFLRVNSGLIVMRRHWLERHAKRVMQIAAQNNSYDGGDQGVLNDLLAEDRTDFRLLDLRFNALRRLYQHHREQWGKADIRLIHFVGSKPWSDVHETPELVRLWRGYV